MKNETYFSVDIESAGPIPGKYSMLSLGACVVGRPAKSFYVELKPISSAFVPAALEISGFSLKALRKTGIDPKKAMTDFARWVGQSAAKRKAIFVGFNGCYDWQFVNWYFDTYLGENPFGFGGIDIKSYHMGLRGLPWGKTTSSQLVAGWLSSPRVRRARSGDRLPYHARPNLGISPSHGRRLRFRRATALPSV